MSSNPHRNMFRNIVSHPRRNATPWNPVGVPAVLRRAVSVIVLASAAVACTGIPRSETPVVVEPSPTQTLPVLLPVSLYELTERPPENGFEYALRESSWPVKDWGVIRALVQCESGGDSSAVGRLGERGILQIHPVHELPYDLSTYEGSLSAARVVHDQAVEMGRAGFSPWSCWAGGE